MAEKSDRRSFLNKALLGAAGIGAVCSREESILLAALQDGKDQGEKPKPEVAPAGMPCGKIGNISISRLFLGGNLIGGWSHSRDLIYISNLFKAYNTEAKIFETFELAQQYGINTVLLDPRDWPVVEKYNKARTQKIQTMVCILPLLDDKAKMRDHVKELADKGPTLLYTQGAHTDPRTKAGEIDVIGMAVDLIKEQGLLAGVGAHSLETPIACEKHNLNADFYVKTLHMDRYWSATPEENRDEWCWYKGMRSEHDQYHDNMWCLDADKTIAFMEKLKKPWVAFKVMAAGAIPPRTAFPYAYQNGADFIVAGMFDFQIEYDTKIAVESLQKSGSRKRPWCA
jgi:hypothetical protein